MEHAARLKSDEELERYICCADFRRELSEVKGFVLIVDPAISRVCAPAKCDVCGHLHPAGKLISCRPFGSRWTYRWANVAVFDIDEQPLPLPIAPTINGVPVLNLYANGL